jgi:parvulin-like peptidyl-prolyl isomerase
MQRRIALLTLPALLLLAAPRMGAEIIEQVLVKVNGEIITKSEFETRQIAELRARPELATGNPTQAQLEALVAEITPELILNMVDELLFVQRGREQGYALGDEQFEEIVDDIKTRNNLDTDEKFAEALQQEGMTQADLRRSMENRIIAQAVVREEVTSKITVTEEEARTYYEDHREELTTPSEVTLREMLFAVPVSEQGVNVAEDDAALARAREVRERLVAGEPFARLAGGYSGAASRANGGLIGPFQTSELAPQLVELLAPMAVGDITEPIRTDRGYMILKLESRVGATLPPFEQVRSQITNQIGQGRIEREQERYLDRLRSQATIAWRNEELQKAYDTALAARRSGAEPSASAPAVGGN